MFNQAYGRRLVLRMRMSRLPIGRYPVGERVGALGGVQPRGWCSNPHLCPQVWKGEVPSDFRKKYCAKATIDIKYQNISMYQT